MERKTCSQEEVWVGLEKLGSPFSFVAPQRLSANTRPVSIRGQLTVDCSAPSWRRVVPPRKVISYGHVIISLFLQPGNCRRPLESLRVGGGLRKQRLPVGCSQWQLFKLKVTAGWIGLIYCQSQSSLTPFCVRACQHPGSDLFTSLH